ncbi:MAG: hypothetical protein Q9170_000427 [Blastenia crenularia]
MQMIALKADLTAFSRRADAKIALLKEVIERVQKGEEVDVKGLLGTGNPEKEKEWEQGQDLNMVLSSMCLADCVMIAAIQEIEEEDRLWQSKARRREQKNSRMAESTKGKEAVEKEAVPENKATQPTSEDVGTAGPTRSRKILDAFY